MNILYITRHYPPEISGGARRPYLYVKALRELGNKVTVVTPFELDDPNSITVYDAALSNNKYTAVKESNNFLIRFYNFIKVKIVTWSRWPDPNIKWVNKVIKKVKKSHLKPDWIITTSPPESIHAAGAKLSKALNASWLAEFRDTWINFPHREELSTSAFRRYIEKKIAKKYLKHANVLTCVSEEVFNDIKTYAKQHTPYLIVPHFSDKKNAKYDFNNNGINLVHTGGFTLSDRRRNIQPLLEKLNLAYDHNKNLVLHIAGSLTKSEESMLRKSRIKTLYHGPVSLDKSRAMQISADGLILCTPQNAHALPGKYAEYVTTNKPIYYTGSGNWLNLVYEKSSIFPIEELSEIKNSQLFNNRNIVTDMEAAKALNKFLKKNS
jgi:glycosyltransferase involved in cell wall biosynthesis